jgi:uncharacterized RDD family membrane protein YckC
MGRRIGAHVLDGLLPLVVALVAILAFVDIRERPGLGSCRGVSGLCAQLDDTVYTSGFAPLWLLWGIPLAYGIFFGVVVQGLTGATPGKLAFGVRTVRADGGRPGVGKALVRWLLLVVDGIGCGLPLVGLITALVSKGHRRVGDMVASTFVVDRHDTDRPIILPGAVSPTMAPGLHSPAPFTPAPFAGAPPFAGARPGPPSPPPTPQWDADRGTYVLWDPAQQRWLAYDPDRQEWRDL